MSREFFSYIKTLTFLVHDVEALKKLEEDLRDLLEGWKQHGIFEDVFIKIILNAWLFPIKQIDQELLPKRKPKKSF